MLIVFSGLIGQSGLGGQAWAAMQYLAGLRALGHDVVYLEDSGEWSSVYNWETSDQTTDIDYPAACVRDSMRVIGMDAHWIYRAGAQNRGMQLGEFTEFCSRADLLLMRAAPLSLWREEYSLPRRRAFIDVDPGFTQMRMANGDTAYESWVKRCDRHFTVGMNVGSPDCTVPAAGFEWRHTLPPVALDYWPVASDHTAHNFTSLMRWRGFVDVQFAGAEYGQKDRSFPAYIDLPRRTPQSFLLGVLGADHRLLEEHGWQVVAGDAATRTPDDYRNFIAESRAEFSVPKHGYMVSRSGWFSDRSACYLASGRPVLTGDTALEGILPVGDGLLTFNSPKEALRGVESINSNYDSHARAARLIAEEHLDATKVLPPLLDHALD